MSPFPNFARLRDRTVWMRPSVIALVAANLAPLLGVVGFGWDVFPLMLLFWAENVVIGGFNILKMLTSRAGGAVATVAKLFFIPFFTVHYGLFTFVHGSFILGLFGGDQFRGPDVGRFASAISEHELWLPLLGLVASHGVSFVTNYLGAGEFRRATLPALMMQPYGRVVILHVTILGGGFLMLLLKSPAAGLALLVLVKTAFDLAAHLNERDRFQPSVPAAQ